MKQELRQLKEINEYDEMIKYLNQDNEYWLQNDKWDMWKIYQYDLKQIRGKRYLEFSGFDNDNIKLEFKYMIVFCVKNRYFKVKDFMNYAQASLNSFKKYIEKENISSITEIEMYHFHMYLLNQKQLSQISCKSYLNKFVTGIQIIKDFFDNRNEIEKDIWNCKKITGIRIPANSEKGYVINFNRYPQFYRECLKRYFRTIITKKSISQCINIHTALVGFFEAFYEMNYQNGFLKDLTREDIEKYIFHLNDKYKGKNVTYVNKFLSYPRTFLEYIQIAGYEEAPVKEVSFLIYRDDIPKREKDVDRLQRVKFIPEPILQQLDDKIMGLDRPEVLPIYVLLRETGWRGIDILNLRYNSCLEKIWNGKEKKYNYYLCGEITKTGIANLKIPIRNTVAQMLEKCIETARGKSNDDNNPHKYLFNVYEGKRKGMPIPKTRLLSSIGRLIKKENILDENGEIFHFKAHSLRHTRAKEYVEQGISISIIQQILGHRSLQMTVHYATVTENTLYEQWKNTEDLNLFKIDGDNKKQKINTKDDDNLVKYEYVRKNLDAVKVPFGVCFKPSKLPCKQQINQCLTCASFCTTDENLQEYKEEIARVEEQIKISEKCGRTLWKEKNEEYLKLLNGMVHKIQENHIVHKNGNSREEN